MLRSMSDLLGLTIGATDGDIGQADAFYFDDTTFTVRHLVVDTSGWLTGRNVLVSPMAPCHRLGRQAHQRGADDYWEGPYLWGLGPYPVMTPGGEVLEYERRWEWGAKQRNDPHLRSSGAVIGYHIGRPSYWERRVQSEHHGGSKRRPPRTKPAPRA